MLDVLKVFQFFKPVMKASMNAFANKRWKLTDVWQSLPNSLRMTCMTESICLKLGNICESLFPQEKFNAHRAGDNLTARRTWQLVQWIATLKILNKQEGQRKNIDKYFYRAESPPSPPQLNRSCFDKWSYCASLKSLDMQEGQLKPIDKHVQEQGCDSDLHVMEWGQAQIFKSRVYSNVIHVYIPWHSHQTTSYSTPWTLFHK